MVVSACAAAPDAMTAPAVSAPADNERRTHVFIVEGTSFDLSEHSDQLDTYGQTNEIVSAVGIDTSACRQ
jgi:hypothetical protein